MNETQNPFIEHDATCRDKHGGVQWEFRFPNGYGASVIRSEYSYGGQDGLWELAVLDSTGRLTYDTPVTSDVLGWLSEDDVREHLRTIATLAKEDANA